MPSRNPAALRMAAALALSALAVAGCGARLTPAQRADALGQFKGGATTTGSTGDTSGTSTGTGTGTGTGAGTSTSGTSGTSGTTSTTGTSGTTGSTGTSGTTGTTGSTGTTGTTGTTGGPAASGDFTKAPAGGNGGKTDVGITADSITIYNISDVSGAIPGLFEDARFATQAYMKYFAARYGTVYGRKIILKTLDSQLDAGAARSGAIELCASGFAGVGSISAFDQGAADPEKQCNVPDIRGLATTDQMKAVPSVFPANAAGVGKYRGLAQFAWAAKSSDPKIAASVKKAAYVFSDGEVTRQQTSQDEEATTKAYGFTWIANEPVPTSATDYTSVVADLKKQGAEFVAFTGAYQQAANLVKTFADQDYHPTVWQPTVTAYTPDYLAQAGATAEGTYLGIQPSLLEEADQSPELQLYGQWLNQVSPGAHPTDLGQFAWGASALFIQDIIKLGPKPTRKALIALLQQEHNFTDNDLFPGQDVGGRRLSDCIQIIRVINGKFTRVLPAQKRTWRCEDGVWDFTTGKKIPGFPK